MWKVVLAFSSHRFLLFIVALFVINAKVPSTPRPGALPELHPTHLLLSGFRTRVGEAWEFQKARALRDVPARRIFKETSNPFFWFTRWVGELTGMSTFLTVLLLSNFFALLFFWELHSLLNRMLTPEVATSATILALVWPTSFEMSIGSLFGMTCFFSTLAIRHALDNQWLIGGIAVGLLAMVEPFSIALLPLLLYLFWYFQRHFPIGQVIKRACFFLVPAGVALFLNRHTYLRLGGIFSDSALFNLFSAFSASEGSGWAVSRSYAGETLTIIFFTVGAVTAFLSNTTFVHRLIPLHMLLVLLLFSPYGAVASRAPLAGVCLEGIASASSRPVAWIVHLLLIALGIYEVYFIFSA